MALGVSRSAADREQMVESRLQRKRDSATAVRLSLKVVIAFVMFAVLVALVADAAYFRYFSDNADSNFEFAGSIVAFMLFTFATAVLLFVAVWSVARELVTAKRRMHQSEKELIRRLGQAAEWRDDETGDHTIRVGEYCGAIAQAMGCDRAFCEAIKTAAMLHDIGKIGIPDFVMVKAGDLSMEERQLIHAHTLMGSDILADSNIPLIQMAQKIAASHHEKWDGSGYPYSLSGEDIPVEGRIAALADVFDALTSKRRYKSAWSFEESVSEIVDLSGTHFDPRVVRAFQTALPNVKETYERLQSKARLFNVNRAA